MIKAINPDRVQEIKNPHGVSIRKLHDGEYSQFLYITLLPNEKIKETITAIDVLFYILEGTGIVVIGEDHIKVSAEMLLEGPANIPHYVTNDSHELFRFLVIKILRPNIKSFNVRS